MRAAHTCAPHEVPSYLCRCNGRARRSLTPTALGARLRSHVHPNAPRPVPTLRSSLCRSFRATLSFTVFAVLSCREHRILPHEHKVKPAASPNHSQPAAQISSVSTGKSARGTKHADTPRRGPGLPPRGRSGRRGRRPLRGVLGARRGCDKKPPPANRGRKLLEFFRVCRGDDQPAATTSTRLTVRSPSSLNSSTSSLSALGFTVSV